MRDFDDQEFYIGENPIKPTSLRIEISSNNLTENPQMLKRQLFKPTITAEDKSIILQHCLRLKAENIRLYKFEAVKLFFKDKYFEEYKNFEKYDDWKKCPITGKMVFRWETKFNHARSEEKIKFDEEKNQFLLNPPAAFQISSVHKNEIILEGIKLEGTTKQPRLAVIKWFIGKYQPDYFEIYKKFGGWHKCFLTPKRVEHWIRRFKEKAVLPKKVRRTERKFSDNIINKGKKLALMILNFQGVIFE
jgi:hypothetical protein